MESYEKSLAIKIRQVGDMHLDVASSYNNIGGVYLDDGDHLRALACYERCLEITVQAVGEVPLLLYYSQA